MIPQEFHQPWSEIDPTGAHGGLPGALGEYVGARLGDNPQTKNIDVHTIFSVTRDCAASLSMHPYANVEGPPEQGFVEKVLRALNYIMERMMDRTKTQATGFFTWCHATPPMLNFTQRPIRYPLRNIFAHTAIYHLLGDMVEIAENNANGYHSWMDPSASLRVLGPLVHFKGNLIRDWFDQEVAEEISLEELSNLFKDVARPGPTVVPTGESQPTPTPEDTGEVMTGAKVIQWYPTKELWAVFARKRAELFKAENIWQPEGAGAATEDIAPENPTPTPVPVTPG